MEDCSQTLTIELHYHLDKENFHEMDANIHNRCEAYIIESINHLADLFDEDISLDVSALEEGGIIDKLKITINNPTAKSVMLIMTGALINHFISPSIILDDTQKMLNRAEIVQKIKDGNYNDAEIKFVISGDIKIITAKSKYYKELNKEPHVTRVSCSTIGEKCPAKALVSNGINKDDFDKQIIKNTNRIEIQEYTGTTVLVIAPVLSKVSKAKWRGVFNGEDVTFRVRDKEFLQQIYNKEVGFTTGTSLKCDVQITFKTMYDICGDVLSTTKEIIVTNIMSWYDGETFQRETKRYKRKKNNDSQLSLFEEEDF